MNHSGLANGQKLYLSIKKRLRWRTKFIRVAGAISSEVISGGFPEGRQTPLPNNSIGH
jgi:hypothetical protein